MSSLERGRAGAVDRRELLGWAAGLSLAAACASERGGRGEARAKNVLVLFADDMGWRDAGCYGNRDVRTPAIDALAARGVRFTRAYTAVGVCQPSRSSLLTGLYPHHHGALGFEPIRSDVATWPEILRERGVATALIGKLDVDPIEKFPFDVLVKAKDMASRRNAAEFERPFRDFLAQCGDRPFAAVIAFSDPHRPFEEEMSSPMTDPARISVPKTLWDAEGTRKDLAQYYDCVARLDHGVERMLTALRDAGHADDTLVIFTSDNGPAFPFAKATLYEAGVRMPLVVSGPGVRAGVSDELVSLVDVLPTALDVFRAPPRKLDGVSWMPLLRERGRVGREFIITMQTENNREQSAPGRAVHTQRFAYLRNFGPPQATVSNVVNHTPTWEAGKELAQHDSAIAARMKTYIYRSREELYDLERDPDELTNLAEDPSHAAELDELRRTLRSWMEQHSDPLLARWDE